MATTKQKRVAKLIVENVSKSKPLTDIEILKRSNYSTTTAETKSTYVIQSEGVQEALRDFGFSEDNAKKVVSEIMLDSKKDPNARLKATDQVFKVHGSYKNDEGQGNKTLIINIIPETATRYAISSSTEDNSTG